MKTVLETARTVRVRNLTRNTVLGVRVGIARSSLARMKGLLGTSSLPAGAGLLIVDTQSIHMVGMAYPIDAVFVTEPDALGECAVTKAAADVAAWTGVVWWARGAHSVIELPAGAIAESGTAVGDRLLIEAVDESGA